MGCYLGMPLLGTLKGVTLGGLLMVHFGALLTGDPVVLIPVVLSLCLPCTLLSTLWGLVDGIVILINMLTKAPTINSLGFQAQFPKDELDVAFWISVVGILPFSGLMCVCVYVFSRSSMANARMRRQNVENDLEEEP